MVRVAVLAAPPTLAEIVAVVLVVTFVVFTVNVPDDLPAGMITVFGGTAEVLLLVTVTRRPPVGAGPLTVIVPVLVLPPVTLVGESVSETKAAWLTVKVAVCEIAPWVPVTTTTVGLGVAVVVALKVALICPAGIVTDAGTTTNLLPLLSLTIMPPFGARPLRVAVPTLPAPPMTVFGLKLSDANEIGDIVSVAVSEKPFNEAEIVATVCTVTALAVTVNVADICPAGIVTEDGTTADLLLLMRLMVKPPAFAGPLRVTVPVDVVAPATDAGFSETEARVTAVSERLAVFVTPP